MTTTLTPPPSTPPAVRRLPTPAEIVAHLDRFIVGQNTAKRVLASAVYSHYRLCHATETNGSRVPARHRNVLMTGPTGVGKTEMVRQLTEFLQVPSVYMSATALTQSGYIGQKPVDMLRRLLELTKGDLDAARRGLIFLDEIDKRRLNPGATGPDVAGVGVQMDLLPYLDGSVVDVRFEDRTYPFDTSEVLIIAAGAFTGIGRRPVDGRLAVDGGEEVAAQDLVEYGLLDEFVGRFAQIVELSPLSIADYERLIDTPQLLAAERRLMALHNVSLDVTPAARSLIARMASEEENGARGLPRILKRVLRDVLFELPQLRGGTITVDCEAGARVVARGGNAATEFLSMWAAKTNGRPTPSGTDPLGRFSADTHFSAPGGIVVRAPR